MDTGDLNHFGIAPATAFPVYQNDESRLPIFQNEMYNQNGSTRYAGASCGYSSIIYEPLPVFPHPGGYIPGTYQAYPYGATLDVTNLMPYGSQFNHVQQPMSRRNFMSYGDSLSVPYYSQVGSTSNFVPSCLYHTEPFDRDVYTQLKIPFGSSDYIKFSSLDHNMVGGLMSSGQNLVNGFWSPGHQIGGWPWMNNNGGLTYGIHPRAGSSSSNFFPMPQGHFHHCSPMPNDRNRSVCGGRDARYANGDPNRCFHGSVSASKPLPYKNKARLSSMGSENITVTTIPNGRNTFRSQHGSKDRVRTSLNESSKVSPTIRATDSTFGNIRSGRAQWSQLAQSSKDPALPIRKSGIQTTLAPRQVWQRKTKAQPSIRPSKPSSKRTRPTYHIRWNDMSQGFDESCQTVGENCHLCNQDLATAPTDYGSEGDYEFELSNLPNVDVLPCGHSFHSECLQLNKPEDQSRDPLCAICAYGFF